jgi:hypothetical protein
MIAQSEAHASCTAACGAPSPVPAQPASSGPVVVSSGPGGVAARVLSGHSAGLAPLAGAGAGGAIRPVRAAPLLPGRRGALLRVARLAGDRSSRCDLPKQQLP